MVFPQFQETILKPNNNLAENPKIAFWEEFSFQTYKSFSTNSKQNRLLLISSINIKIGVIFGGLEEQF